MNNQF